MTSEGNFRESATESKPPAMQVRVKGCGKSAPPLWRQRGHGKPHLVQNRIGTTGFGRFSSEVSFGLIA